MAERKIIEIDEEKCTGCGECILACAEGALELVDGVAKVVGDVYCDGLGACIGDCPEGALSIVVREAQDFDEEMVEERLKSLSSAEEGRGGGEAPLACGCPGESAVEFKPTGIAPRGAIGAGSTQSELSHWPIKLKLLGPGAPFLKGRDLVLMADCAGVAYPNLHSDFIEGRVVAIGCPKFDDHEADVKRLSDIIREADLNSLSVVTMEVPCCGGLVVVAEKAAKEAGAELDITRVVIGREGEIVSVTPVAAA